MKFSDGLWLNQRGFDVSYAVQAYDVTTTKNSIKIFATSSAIWNRAMTLGGVAFEITYTAVAPDMIRVHICHHKGGLQNKPQFELNLPEGYVPDDIHEEDGFVSMTAGHTTLKIKKVQTAGTFRSPVTASGSPAAAGVPLPTFRKTSSTATHVWLSRPTTTSSTTRRTHTTLSCGNS